jgi:hypothetical protein
MDFTIKATRILPFEMAFEFYFREVVFQTAFNFHCPFWSMKNWLEQIIAGAPEAHFLYECTTFETDSTGKEGMYISFTKIGHQQIESGKLKLVIESSHSDKLIVELSPYDLIKALYGAFYHKYRYRIQYIVQKYKLENPTEEFYNLLEIGELRSEIIETYLLAPSEQM